MIALSLSEQEILRHVVLEYLVERQRFYFAPDAITRALPRRNYVDFAIDTENVRRALWLLEEKRLVKSKIDDLGSTRCFAASAEGILTEERRQAEGTI
jgi:Fe2+ or Zn2+ uptake regulation protein